MKKFGIVLFAAFLAFGLVACGGEGGTDTKDPVTTNTNTPTPTPTNTTTPTPPPTEPDKPSLPVTTVEFEEESHNFGEIKEGEKVKHTFNFTNTGDQPLLIENVKPSCGCTTPNWTKEEVAPGKKGFVEVEFDSKNKKGVQRKSVTMTMNTEPRNKILNFTGEVIATDGGDAAPNK